ncbi:M6 family metalloprotease domain-containing protein [Pseudoduganella lutea]|uniref:M6 family metalloprotease domain-containing protein n=2 Tax=Pseudoduganella lutea TaxID=321985 RepID=A0A4P6L5Z5_9BURK|nr:M6 family metalloprotease domain-containing protein [Pseudoduganella lutea]
MVAPSPELNERLRKEIAALSSQFTSRSGLRLRATEPRAEGFNDGMIIPPSEFPLGTSPSVIRNQALDRAPLHGTVRVIVVLVDFSDQPMARTASDLDQLFFSDGVVPTGSVREYFTEVTHGLVDLQGQVVGPFRLPQTLAAYCNGDSGTGNALPNARTMARDALSAADPGVDFGPYDNDGNGFVDAFVVVHAGAGAEETGSSGDIWSHKWTLPSGAVTTDGTKVFGYLTVPEDCKIGVCAHELGHLLFGFPDLYDTDGSSEGIGRFCLMAAGSWGGGGDTPTHPSAWCKANQGWATVDNVTVNGMRSIADVKDSQSVLRLWKDGASGAEYFLVENRQQTGFDASLPGGGLLIWHIDESVATNTNEARYKVALVQADNQRDLENSNNRGDAGDPYPGSTGNSSFTNTSAPNSKSYGGQKTCVSVTSISAPGAVMTANVKVKCGLKPAKEFTKDKEFAKELQPEKPVLDKNFDKPILDKRPEKPVIDKSASFDKPFDKPFEKQGDKPVDGGGLPGGFGGGWGGGMMEARMAQLEAIVGTLLGQPGGQQAQQAPQPFIGAGLRPDLSQGALAGEDDTRQEAMRRGDAAGKRSYDTKPGDV